MTRDRAVCRYYKCLSQATRFGSILKDPDQFLIADSAPLATTGGVQVRYCDDHLAEVVAKGFDFIPEYVPSRAGQ